MAGDDKKVRTVRLSDEEYNKLIGQYGSLSGALKLMLDAAPAPEEGERRRSTWTPPMFVKGSANPRAGLTPRMWPYPSQVRRWEDLLLPVGDLIGSDHIRPWPVNPALHKQIEELFEPWALNGFVLIWGDPQPYTRESPSTRLQASFAGDREVWCDFVGDVKAGMEYLQTNTQVIVPMVPDLTRYNNDEAYQELYKLYHLNYKVYFLSGKPRTVD